MEKASENQIGGNHYKGMAIQPGVFCQANRLPFWESCVIKRMCRHRSKNGKEDLLKAIHEIQLIIEQDYPDAPQLTEACDKVCETVLKHRGVGDPFPRCTAFYEKKFQCKWIAGHEGFHHHTSPDKDVEWR